MKKIARFIENCIIRSLESFPVVYIAGPRQSGKTTLVQHIANTRHQAQYISFDDLQMLSAAKKDPEGFLRSFNGNLVIDEIQLAPEIFRPLKIIVDENRNLKNMGIGKFLLTGSASVMALPQLSDALVGRMALHNLLPFSTGEIAKNPSKNFIDRIFINKWQFTKLPKYNLLEIIRKSSFPELFRITNNSLRYEWCNGYINTILQRDVRSLMEIEKIANLPDMLRILATRTGGLLNENSLSRDTELNHITAKKYRLILEGLFLTQSVSAWSSNLGKRLIKSPKIYISDLNLLAYLLNVNFDNLPKENPVLFGQVLENFVAIELAKQITASETNANIYHYRTAAGQEVDFILEGKENNIIGIEVKSKTKVSDRDFRHLESLQKDLGNKFLQGIVLYNGTDILPFGKDMWAVPFSVLWS